MAAETKTPTVPPPKALPSSGAVVPSSSKAASFQKIKTTNRGSTIILYGPEGSGKTTIGAYAPGSKFILAPQEMGLLTLYRYGRIPEREYAAPATWAELLATVNSVDSCKVLVLDALSGFERLCHEHVCKFEFGGDWGEKGFLSYHKGYERSLPEWKKLLHSLDHLRNRGTSILMLSHQQVKTVKNPLGEDYDRCVPDCHPKTWGLTHKWADAVLFLTFFQVLDKSKGENRVKGIGGRDRVVYAERTDAWDAKNRFGLPEVFDIPNDPALSWSALASAIEGENSNREPSSPPASPAREESLRDGGDYLHPRRNYRNPPPSPPVVIPTHSSAGKDGE